MVLRDSVTQAFTRYSIPPCSRHDDACIAFDDDSHLLLGIYDTNENRNWKCMMHDVRYEKQPCMHA